MIDPNERKPLHDIEAKLQAYFATIIEEPLPPRLLQLLSILSRLEDDADLDKVVILRPLTTSRAVSPPET